ncbi:glycosyltransferase family 2 protein [Streptococcus oralis]|uniref:glycosyltransferase family 2 protein n=1 Tax=Streptococcus oralis TaxID=1303 RepID=UPI002000D999|nr:glycosyltransferase family 2 protein [Streptococcus oralis]
MKYSVIIPVYNVEKYLKRCIDSIVIQEYKDLEILLIDNGSSDGSGLICDNYADKNSQITAYHIPNDGVGAARNFGLLKAQGEFVYFVDADDYLVGNLFADMENKLHSKVDLLVFSYHHSMEKKLTELKRTTNILPYNGIIDKDTFIVLFKELFLTAMMYTVWNKIYRRDFLAEHHLTFSEHELGEDVRFNLKVYDLVENLILSTNYYYVYISGRKGSAMRKYNPQRIIYQLEELSQIELLLTKWGKSDQAFIDELKSRILMSNIQNIANQRLSIKLKIDLLKENLKNEEMNKLIFSHVNNLNPVIKFLLMHQWYRAVLAIKQIQASIKRR